MSWKYQRPKRILLILLGVAFVAAAYFFVGIPSKDPDTRYGITWSDNYAQSLGLDPKEGFSATLNDLRVNRYRLPTYWSETEPSRGEYHLDRLQEQLDALQEHHAKAVLVVGATQPRWPECWLPKWAEMLPREEREAAQKEYVKKIFDTFAHHPALEMWQVENESQFFAFGNCKDQPITFLREEIKLVKDLEASTFPAAMRHPVATTDTGELSFWLWFPNQTDALGISIYRKVFTVGGVWSYAFIPPYFYRRHANLVSPWTGPVYVSEFQMEPWSDKPLTDTPLDQQYRIMNPDQMRSNFWFAERVQLPMVYFWGAEWWYWMKVKMNHPEYWEMAKTFFAGHP